MKLEPLIVPPGTKLRMPVKDSQTTVVEDDPAIKVMTDFQHIQPVHTSPIANINQANEKMVSNGVRLLFVQTGHGGLVGLITSTDILGEKPLSYLSIHGGTREDILVQSIMTPVDKLEAMTMEQVENARVADIIEAFSRSRRQHMLTLEEFGEDRYVRGMFSLTQLGRQLGRELISASVKSFAEM